MSAETIVPDAVLTRILEAVRRYWGFDELRPLQEQAIRAGLDRRDSLVVMPTGGGKSLCYQVPPLLAERTDVVVSPLISLMKDQVDGLRACGYPAAALHSGLTPEAKREAETFIASGKCRLVFVAPERLLTPWFLNLMDRLSVRSFAIDEAHCISHWGHDFRHDYRQLAVLKQRFSGVSLHGYTATATSRVRDDIVAQLQLENPAVLVGCFDRPNLVYRVVPRNDRQRQVLEVVRRHQKQAVIVYCISRNDTETLAGFLSQQGVRAAHYHAGMNPDARRSTQDDFANERIDVVVATVAFGMGIDRSDVRCVLHAALPKSIEHYQQETGRAGRDGLEAECVLLYSPADAMKWESLIEKSAQEARNPEEVSAAAMELLRHMRGYCLPNRCRHKTLSEYFGQAYEQENCNACDICLDESEGTEDGTVTAQKILSCVARVGQRFGVTHIVDVLRGAKTERILSLGHTELSTYGLMKEFDAKSLTNLTYQLLEQGQVSRSTGDYPVLVLNDASWQVLSGKRKVRLIPPKTKAAVSPVRQTRYDKASWQGVDKDLFESLRGLRTEIARERKVPPYVVFSDATLRDLARRRPVTPAAFLAVHGVGEKKLADLGEVFLSHIQSNSSDHDQTGASEPEPDDGSSNDAEHRQTVDAGRVPSKNLCPAKRKAFELFAALKEIDEVMGEIDRAHSTTVGYLADFIAIYRPERIDAWVDDETYELAADAALNVGARLLKPIHEFLKEQVAYDDIRLVVSHLEAMDMESPTSNEPP